MRSAGFICLMTALAASAMATSVSARGHGAKLDGEIVVDAAHVLQTFRPDETLGGALDGAGKDEINGQFTPHNVGAMLSAGLMPVTYRLRTELGIEAWHWNEDGAWSDPLHSQGYWTSSDKPGAPILMSHGYALPRRGDTMDNANESSWSRLDDGSEDAFWKTNPYLDKTYTHLADNHPQWAIANLGSEQLVDTIKVAWGEPYATAYHLQYWVGVDEYDPAGKWVDFPRGAVTDGHGGLSVLRLPEPVKAHFVRLLLIQGSDTAPAGSTDIRDRLGFAVREWYIGKTGADGSFTDYVRHAPERTKQTWMLVSSSDPWHRAIDRDDDLEQPGIDLVYNSGITRGLPVMLPVGAIYDTPENAAALIRYVKARGYKVRGIELGEEPDGQLM
ncbi:MAG: discoidin domain-containing protein, partial [Asticcacaulis sp.]